MVKEVAARLPIYPDATEVDTITAKLRFVCLRCGTPWKITAKYTLLILVEVVLLPKGSKKDRRRLVEGRQEASRNTAKPSLRQKLPLPVFKT